VKTYGTFTLYRPVGLEGLKLIESSGGRRRLSSQPFFYPVLREDYAVQIARDWNARDTGAGIVPRFSVDADFVRRYPTRTVRSSQHQELWIPAEELSEFNDHIVGNIEVVSSFEPPRVSVERGAATSE
jgi:hypothetical protein